MCSILVPDSHSDYCIHCNPWGLDSLFFLIGKKIDLDKKTYPSPFTLNRLRAIYKKPRWVGGGFSIRLLPLHLLIVL